VKLEWLLWHVPGLGRLMYLQSQAEVFLVLSLTFRTGVPLLDCLTLAANGSSWKRISKDLKMAMVGLQQGQKLSQILTKMAWQPQVLQLIRVGEASGNLALSFTQLQGYYEAQVVNQSQWLEQLLEPVLLIVVAVFVGLILVALYLPLFQVGQMM
jgi:protein transport protein HofC